MVSCKSGVPNGTLTFYMNPNLDFVDTVKIVCDIINVLLLSLFSSKSPLKLRAIYCFSICYTFQKHSVSYNSLSINIRHHL